MASPPINSTYARQQAAQTRRPSMRTRVASPTNPADGLDESSLAPWWNTERYINSNVNSTPFRKQKYEPLKWANAELLMDEDGEEFLVDDPFATPATIQKPRSVRKGGSAKRRRSSLTNQLKASTRSLPSPGPKQRDLTLADLTPRSRRISGGRANRTPRARVSAGQPRHSLHLSRDGPGFGPLLPIQEDLSRVEASPVQEPLAHGSPLRNLESPRPVARTPTSRKSRRSSQQLRNGTYLDPNIIIESTPVTVKPKTPQNSGKSRRKSGRGSIVPVQVPITQEEEDDDEELHRSIPGAFDFLPDHQVQPLPNTIFNFSGEPEPPVVQPEPSTTKSRPASRCPSVAQEKEELSTLGAPVVSLGGFAGKLAEYGDMLMGLINPNDTSLAQPALKSSHSNPRLSEASPRRVKPDTKSIAISKEKKKISSHVPRPVVVRPTSKGTRERLPPQNRIGEQVIAKVVSKSVRSRVPVPQRKDHQKAQKIIPPSTMMNLRHEEQVLETEEQQETERIPADVGVELVQRRQSLPPPFEVITEVTEPPSQQATRRDEEMLKDAQPSLDIQYTGTKYSEDITAPAMPRPRTSLEKSPSPNPFLLEFPPNTVSPPTAQKDVFPQEIKAREELHVLSSHARLEPLSVPEPVPTTITHSEAIVLRNEPSTSFFAAKKPVHASKKTSEEPERENLPSQGRDTLKSKRMDRPIGEKRPLKSILKKRPLEVSPRKSLNADGRASKRQRLESNGMAPAIDMKGQGDTRNRDDRHSRKSKAEAPKKSITQSKLPEEVEDVTIAPLVYASLPERSQERAATREQSQGDHVVGRRDTSTQVIAHDMEEDVFGTVLENSMDLGVTHPRTQDILKDVEVEEEEETPMPPFSDVPMPSTYTRAILQPTTVQNAPEIQNHPPRKTQPLPVEVTKVVHTTEQLLPDRLFAYGTRDHESCRLTVPQSPNFMRVQREREKEKARKEKERLEELEKQLEEQRRERVRKAQQRGMPPIAAALLSKLAGVKDKAAGQKARDISGFPEREFTFVSDLRPMFGRDGAMQAVQTHKEQFTERRRLWEQRSFEASTASSSSNKPHTHERPADITLNFDHQRLVPAAESRSKKHSAARMQGDPGRERFIVRPVRAPPSNFNTRMAERDQRRRGRDRAMPTAREKVISQTQYLLGGRQPSPRRRVGV